MTAQNVIKALKRRKMRVVTTDTNSREFSAGAYFSNKFYQVPLGVDKGFIKALLRIVCKEKIDVVIPIVDEEFIPIATHRNEFEKAGARVLLSDIDTVMVRRDKFKTFLFFREHNILTPDTFLPSQLDSIKKSDFPVLIKPRTGRASLGITKAYDFAGLYSALRHSKNVIIQKFIEGEEFTVDLLSDGNRHILAAIPRLRLEVKAGVSYKGRTVKDHSLIVRVCALVRALNIFGPVNVQCIHAKGRFYFLEVNPRFSGGLPLSVAAGVNLPLLSIDMINGKPMRRYYDFRKDLAMIRFTNELFFETKA